jgi:hypothetical protein
VKASDVALAALDAHMKAYSGTNQLTKDGPVGERFDLLYFRWIRARWDEGDLWVREVWKERP